MLSGISFDHLKSARFFVNFTPTNSNGIFPNTHFRWGTIYFCVEGVKYFCVEWVKIKNLRTSFRRLVETSNNRFCKVKNDNTKLILAPKTHRFRTLIFTLSIAEYPIKYAFFPVK